ncbi:MAG: hypothetical protein ACE5NP_08100 [Anaerolineae bacterium]
MTGKRWDAILFFILVTAQVRITTLADLVAPRPVETIKKVPLLGTLLPERSLDLLRDWLTDPYSLLLITFTFLLLICYMILELMPHRLSAENLYRAKLTIVYLTVLCTVVANSTYLILLRRVAGPASYTHDGGVIQTEETIKYILAGKNPYVEDYVETPMAEWGLDYRTALYHYPYLPFTFLFSVPFYLGSQFLLGWYDQRFVYLILFALTLYLVPRLVKDRTNSLALTMILGLNPIMGVDIIFGQNDSFVLFWIVLSLYFLLSSLKRWLRGYGSLLSTVAFALACASKPTAWFLVPFYFIHRLDRQEISPRRLITLLPGLKGQITVFLLTVFILVLPFLVWDPAAFVDDIWGWSSGTSATAYQIKGWGMANLVLALGLVQSRLDYFPFWILEVIICLPLLIFLLWRQMRVNTVNNVLSHGALLALTFFYFSRFLNENYLGYILALLALGYFLDPGGGETKSTQ